MGIGYVGFAYIETYGLFEFFLVLDVNGTPKRIVWLLPIEMGITHKGLCCCVPVPPNTQEDVCFGLGSIRCVWI